jgi:hypothetical protein
MRPELSKADFDTLSRMKTMRQPAASTSEIRHIAPKDTPKLFRST